MRKFFAFVPMLLIAFSSAAFAAQAEKEWTFLVYLNGNNNLDSFGEMNINQMEKVGSSKDVNVVVQWASISRGSTLRLEVKKDSDTNKVSSPVIQNMGAVDMGDWKSIVDFVAWGAKNYPAKHYFLNIWDHGSGWHELKLHALKQGVELHPTDISWDDTTKHFITTKQLGDAVRESANVIGHKIDLVGSDSCLMAMAEVVDEFSDSADAFVGSEETEPVAGWPYDAFLQRWIAKPDAKATEVGTMLVDEYVKSYSGGQNGNSEVTLSTFDLSKLGRLKTAVSKLAADIQSLDAAGKSLVKEAVGNTVSYTYSDYIDLGDFAVQAEKLQIHFSRGSVDELKAAVKDFVVSSQNSGMFAPSQGVAIWFPSYKSTYEDYIGKYSTLNFDQATQWSKAITAVMGASPITLSLR